MNIVLISAIFSDLGICTLAPLLKKEGHHVRLLFIPQLLKELFSIPSKSMVKNTVEFIGNADLVGINSFSENYSSVAILAEGIKKTVKAPVIWGGIHATLKPDDCIRYADIVCVGEGEKALLELTKRFEKGEALKGIKNLLYKSSEDNKETKELYPPVDLNELPPLDYDLDTQYILENNRIRNVEESDFKGIFYGLSSRGCPFRCSYCCSAIMHDMYKGYKTCRQRAVDKVIEDLCGIKKRFFSCKHIWFNEADFISGKSQEDIEYFSQRYKTKINIPFSIWSHPAAINDRCIKALKNAGLVGINVGTISGSDKTQRVIYKRHASSIFYKEKAGILNKYGIRVEYDFILCNPYEDTDDVVSSIKFLTGLPKPFKTVIYSLTYFPKTELYEMALKDGIISKRQAVAGYTKATYKTWHFKSENSYINIVASMMRGRARRVKILNMNVYGILPEPMLRFLIRKNVIKIFNSALLSRIIYPLIGNFIMVLYMMLNRILTPLKNKLFAPTKSIKYAHAKYVKTKS